MTLQLAGNILITGGTGSLGQAIVARAERENWPAIFTIVSRDEVKQGEMRRRYPDHNYILGNVTDLDWMRARLRGIDLLIHAAAYKQVPAAEANSREAVHANVIGSCNIAEAAVAAGVPRVVGISTDKACAPVNAYGASKMLMEKVFQEADGWSDTQFVLCRYGNVLGSRGSIVPLFVQQARTGQQLTVTDVRMTRFWLTIDEAINIILHTALMARRGCIVVPKASASSVCELALAILDVIQPVGHKHDPIKDIGIRPGEKLHEQLLHGGESQHAEQSVTNYLVYPASTPRRNPMLDYGVEYRSDQAPQLSRDDLTERVRPLCE